MRSGSFSRPSGGSGSGPPTPTSASPALSASTAAAAAGGTVPALGAAAKRSSVFTAPTGPHSSLQAVQKALFSKQHEEILSLVHVVPRPSADGGAGGLLSLSHSSSSAATGLASDGKGEQSYFLVLTANTQVKKSMDGFGAPKLHWVKIKAPEHIGADVTYSHKKFKQLKLLKRIGIPASSSAVAGASTPASSASGSLKPKGVEREEFTLVFTSGNTDKLYTFTVKPGTGSGAASATASTGSARSVFVWYCLEMCRIYCGFVPTSNIDTVLYAQLTSEITSFYLSSDASRGGPQSSLGLGALHKELMLSVSKNRRGALENDTRSLDRLNVEEKVVVPSMTQEETKLVHHFLRQIDALQQSSSTTATTRSAAHSTGSPASTSPQVAPIPSHSNINDLESFLLAKLARIETENIESLFDSRLEAASSKLLRDGIQRDLLDGKLEEMSLWINHHNSELSKMQKGIDLIEKRNASLDTQERNQTALYNTLKDVLDSLQLDHQPASTGAEDSDEEDAIAMGGGRKPLPAGGTERLLMSPDFSSSRLEHTLAAAKRLDHVLHLHIEEGRLEDLRAVKEQRAKYELVRKKFTKQAAQAVESIFQETAKKAVQEHARDSDASLSLSTNSSIHRDLRRYLELLHYLERLELDSFLALRGSYTSSFRSVYETKCRAYFTALKKSIAGESKDTRIQSFPDWSAEVARQATRVRSEAGRSVSTSTNASVATLLRAGPNASLAPSQTGKLLATQAFVQALKSITPLCVSEEKFLHEYFGLSAESTGQPSAAVTAAADGKASGAAGALQLRPRGSSAASGAAGSSVGGGKSDTDSIKDLMSDLFRGGLESELKDLCLTGGKMDHFYTLEMLVQCERIMSVQEGASSATPSTPSSSAGGASAASSSEYLSSILTSLSTHLKLSFNHFVDGEIEWMSSLHPSPKRCGVLAPFAKFPALVDRMENVVRAGGAGGEKESSSAASGGGGARNAAGVSRSQAADTSYQKLASALFRWLETVARSDEKYTDVVVMENAHFFHTLFSLPHLKVPPLESFVLRAHQQYTLHARRYIDWSIGYEMPLLVKFWARLEDQLKSIQPEDIPFASELSKHDLRALCKGPLASKTLQKSLSNVLKRIEKHMPKNAAMISVVWSHIQSTFLERFDRFESLVAQCYQSEKIGLTREEIADMFQQMLPTAAAATGNVVSPTYKGSATPSETSRIGRA